MGQTPDDFEEFVYLLSHDVRNSVRAVRELPNWIREDLIDEGINLPAGVSESFAMLETHTNRLDRMLSDLLVYSRVGKNQSTEHVNLAQAIETAISTAQIPDTFLITTALACPTIAVGRRDLSTLLQALLSNAVKHHSATTGKIHITSELIGSECQISFADDGPGIPAACQAKVFKIMTTLKSRDEVEGSGMGLPIVKKIVDFYGGHCWWETSEVHSGAALFLRFPM